MRKIATLDTSKNSELFRNFLIHKSIEVRPGEDTTDLEIWVLSDDDLPKARLHLEHFLQRPMDPVFLNVPELAKKTEPKAEPIKRTSNPYMESLQKSRKDFPVTFFVIFFCILLFVAELFDHSRIIKSFLWISTRGVLEGMGAGLFSEIRSGQVWRLITPVFLHGDFFHIFFNLLWFFQLATIVESGMGSRYLLRLMLVSGVVSNVVFYLIAGPAFEGLSGVIYGLVGFLWGKTRFGNSNFTRNIDVSFINFFVIWYVICWILTALGMRVANSIHGFGACAGFLMAFVNEKGFKGLLRIRFNKEGMYSVLIAMALLIGGVIADRVSY